MTHEQQVMERLDTIDDPELGVSLVDLGLIYDVRCENGRVEVVMTLTTPGCPLHDALIPAVEAAIGELPDVSEVRVSLVWEPAWTLDRIRPEAAAALGIA
jgi:metal-sulfur cluster biosynthetic enzyme